MKYTLFNKNKPIIEIDMDPVNGYIKKIVQIYNLTYLPLCIPIKKGIPDKYALNEWWSGRTIPASRAGLEAALIDMGLSNKNVLIAKCFGLSLSDQYWINPGNLSWDNINFFTNDFSEDVGNALFGKGSSVDIDLASPDNTSDGWLKKKWKIINGERYLLKGGSLPFNQEPLNEVIATRFLERLHIDHVKYEVVFEDEELLSKCKNFITVDTEFVPAYHIYMMEKKPNHVSVYNHYMDNCRKLGLKDAKSFIDNMIILDYIIANTDRHLGNFGVIRDVNTLEIKSIAPIFDNGTSLWHNVLSAQISSGQSINSRPFSRYHSEQIKLVQDFNHFDINKLKGIEEEIDDILSVSAFIDDERRNALVKGVENRIECLKEHIDNTVKDKNIFISETMTGDTIIKSTEQEISDMLKRHGYMPDYIPMDVLADIKSLSNYIGKALAITDIKELAVKSSELPVEQKEIIDRLVKAINV